MSSGQTMLTAAFFVLITMTVMSANKMIIDSETSFYEQEAMEQATGFANALLSEILTKKFDSRVDYSTYQSPPTGGYYWWEGVRYWWYGFDPPNALGPGTAIARIVPWPDVVPYKSIRGTDAYWYDDVDDYNGYERTANSQDITGFRLKAKVYYVTKANPDVDANIQTYYKRIDVTVTQPALLKNGIKVSAIASY